MSMCGRDMFSTEVNGVGTPVGSSSFCVVFETAAV